MELRVCPCGISTNLMRNKPAFMARNSAEQGTPFCGIWQVQFAYEEAGEQKAALVKLRVCPKHALQLNYQKTQSALLVRDRPSTLTSSLRSHQKPCAAVDSCAASRLALLAPSMLLLL